MLLKNKTNNKGEINMNYHKEILRNYDEIVKELQTDIIKKLILSNPKAVYDAYSEIKGPSANPEYSVLRTLCKKHFWEYNFTDTELYPIIEFCKENKKLLAIRELKIISGCGVKQAKDTIDEFFTTKEFLAIRNNGLF